MKSSSANTLQYMVEFLQATENWYKHFVSQYTYKTDIMQPAKPSKANNFTSFPHDMNSLSKSQAFPINTGLSGKRAIKCKKEEKGLRNY